MEQTLDQRRKSSVPTTRSSLATSTSISESHTMDSSSPSTKQERPPTEHRGSNLEPADAQTIKAMEKKNSIAEVDEEESSEEDDGAGTLKKGVSGIGATDKEEKKVMGGKTTQEQGAKDGDSAGVSVGD